MRTFVKLALSAVAASILIAAVTSTASARNLSVSNRNIRITWASLRLEAGSGVLCPITLEGSFRSMTIAKVARNLIGAVTQGIVNQTACTRGIIATFNGLEIYNGVTKSNTLPWHLTYESFVGALPNIRAVRVLLSRFRLGVRDEEEICAAEVGSATDNVTFSAVVGAGGALSTFSPVEGMNRATLIRNSGVICPSTTDVINTGNVTVLNSTTRISITLI
jgi:hypothetical protein